MSRRSGWRGSSPGRSAGTRSPRVIRDVCVFARHNVAQDPPFSRLDLISCCNVLIYLGAVLQRKVLSILHYALKPTGFLVLGPSESIGTLSEFISSGGQEPTRSIACCRPRVRRRCSASEGRRAEDRVDRPAESQPRTEPGWTCCEKPTGWCWPNMALPAPSSTMT